MDRFVFSKDGSKIHYRRLGEASQCLMFVHGWLGNGHWWNSQLEYFSKDFTVVAIDLAGHGESSHDRADWSSTKYAEDILAVLEDINRSNVVLIGHSMSGAYVLEAATLAEMVNGVVLVDTLKNLDQLMTIHQANELVLSLYRSDFTHAVLEVLPQYLFCDETPKEIVAQLQKTFLSNNSEHAIRVIEPLYKMDILAIAKEITIPVRAINSDATPTNIEVNKRYFKDFDYLTIEGTGHYPMLEKPELFNEKLTQVLRML